MGEAIIEIGKRNGGALSTVIDNYLQNFLSDHTKAAYLSDFTDFGVFLNKIGVKIIHPRDVSTTHVIKYRDYLRENYSPTSINRKLSALSSLFQELCCAQVVDINPVGGVKRPPSIVKRERLGFSDREVNRILESYPTENLQGLNNRAVLTFLFFTGCRISEALAVKVKDIEERAGVKAVHIRGKGEKIRTLPIHPKLSRIMDELIERRCKGPEDFLFTRFKGAGEDANEPIKRQTVGELLKTTLKRLKLDQSRSLHSSRRTVISNLLQSGARIESVANLAGHANVNTTLRYNVRQENMEDNPLLTLKYIAD
ncbi:MAG: tyrosine-type recombinase/integrase [Deltaproteobacteria bacterium]|nr:tyrosine-type recombinase/integrase [Deltaproteobacteria bacterium]